MSTLFKAANLATSTFSDGDIKKMSPLWSGNSDLGIDEIKQKWRVIIGEGDANIFLKRLAMTVIVRKERIKRLCKVDPETAEQFEKELAETIRALEEAFVYN